MKDGRLLNAGELFPELELIYVTMFPRHADSNSEKDRHKTDTDV